MLITMTTILILREIARIIFLVSLWIIHWKLNVRFFENMIIRVIARSSFTFWAISETWQIAVEWTTLMGTNDYHIGAEITTIKKVSQAIFFLLVAYKVTKNTTSVDAYYKNT